MVEVRGGINITGVELWTAFQPYSGLEKYRSLDTVDAEALFEVPDGSLLSYFGDPRINIGAEISTIGRASLAHLGLTWGTNVFGTPILIEGTFGAALTNSTLEAQAPPERSVGCPLLFYFNLGLGYQIDEHWSVLGSAYHASHDNFCNYFIPDAKNDGLNGFGLKVGYKF